MSLSMAGTAEHTPVERLAPGEVFAAVGSSPRGLSSGEAVVRLAEHGRNELPAPQGRSVVLRFVAQLTDLFAVVLLVAAGLTLLAYLLGDPPDVGNLQLAIATCWWCCSTRPSDSGRSTWRSGPRRRCGRWCRTARGWCATASASRCRPPSLRSGTWSCWRPGTRCRRTAG
ncbi:cation-transporting P-type ATPase [Actinophytocola sp.]|uniref:cation-transporting P-type ATPase n=1 Tax=Actinophytocola sp. TaxID=1872138 RepID=UPI00345B809E